MTRLTKTMKKDIRARLMAQSPAKKKLDEVDAAHGKLADFLYDQVYDEKTRQQLKKLRQEEFVPTSDNIEVRVPEAHTRLVFCFSKGSLPVKHIHLYSYHRLSKDSTAGKAVIGYVKDCEDANTEYDKLNNEIRQTLNAFTSARELVEAWPEVEPFIPDLERLSANLTAVVLDGLNARLGLAKDTSSQAAETVAA